MKFSEQWLREWVNPEVTTEQLAECLTMAGLEVDSIEPVAGLFTGVVVGQVLETSKHPDAEKLSLCKVDVAEGESLDIVCGASNVRPGLKVPVAKIGAVLPGDFKIKKAKLRGQPSHGMLCAEAELGLADSSDGLMELPDDAPVGEDFRRYLNLDDQIIEVDLTPNRGDCLSLRGLTRDVSALTGATVNDVVIPVVGSQIDDTFPVTVTASEACPRYVGRVIRNVDTGRATPLWMVEKLRRSGIRSIDPVVDVTNYILLELGQPMHAFDLNRLEGSICVRMATPGEKLTLLDDQEITLSDDSLVIADGGRALALAGIMGGKDSGVSEETKDIFLESAFFSPLAIAGKARSYGLHTDSSHRFERGVDFELQRDAVERATALLLEIVGGQPGPVIEVVSEQHLPGRKQIALRRSKITQVLGFAPSDEEIQGILNRLGLPVAESGEGAWSVDVPSYRFDIEIEVDLIEELGRVYGYNRLPTKPPSLKYQRQAFPEAKLDLKKLRRCLLAKDYQETITYSFIDEKIQSLLDPEVPAKPLANPISADLAVMRTTLWGGLLKAVVYNQNRQQDRIRLFETGLRFVESAGELNQTPMLAAVATGLLHDKSWANEKRPVDFFDVKGDLESVLAVTGMAFEFRAGAHPALHPGQCAQILKQGEVVGYLGALHPVIQKELGIKQVPYLFELELSALLEGRTPEFKEVSKFPEVTRDLAFEVDTSVQAGEFVETINTEMGDILAYLSLFDVYEGNGITAGKKSLAFGLTLQHPSRTLKDTEVNESIDRLVSLLKQRFNATLRE